MRVGAMNCRPFLREDHLSYLLGISPDKGKTWTFVDGSGLQNEKARKAVLPALPDSLKLPAKGKPEIIPDVK